MSILLLIKSLENILEKQGGWKHKHDGYPTHSIAVKDHAAYFSRGGRTPGRTVARPSRPKGLWDLKEGQKLILAANLEEGYPEEIVSFVGYDFKKPDEIMIVETDSNELMEVTLDQVSRIP